MIQLDRWIFIASISIVYRIFNHQHIKQIYTNNMSPIEEIKNLCRQCGKQFSQKGKLAEHQRAVHEGVKYPCGQCDLQFSKKGSLARHHRSVHKSS